MAACIALGAQESMSDESGLHERICEERPDQALAMPLVALGADPVHCPRILGSGVDSKRLVCVLLDLAKEL